MALTERERAAKINARNQLAVQILPVVLEGFSKSGLSLQGEKNAVDSAFRVADDMIGRIDDSMAEFGRSANIVTPK